MRTRSAAFSFLADIFGWLNRTSHRKQKRWDPTIYRGRTDAPSEGSPSERSQLQRWEELEQERQQWLARWESWRRERTLGERQQMLLQFRWREDMSPLEFERCCADYLALKGWNTRTTKASGDQGADVVAESQGAVLVLQCKLYSQPVGNDAVQQAFTARAFHDATRAAVVSN